MQYILGFFYFPIDKWYIILIVPTMLLSFYAQFSVQNSFARFSQIRGSRNLSGAQVAKSILQTHCPNYVAVERVPGMLTDHYSPQEEVLRLSESVFDSHSIAALGVAAHECGHAIQHAENYGPLALRSGLYPVARIGSGAGPYLALIGLVLNFEILFTVGIIFFAAAVLFYLITLPVEFDASKRALAILEEDNFLNQEELQGARKVLRAAAMTYVASAATAFASMLRLIMINRDRRN